MMLKETKNIDDIKAILCHKDIYDCISSDYNSKAEDFEPPLDDIYRYVGGYVDGEIFALMVYHNVEDHELCHIQVLPEYRQEYATEYAKKALEFKSELPLFAQIPSCYKNVLRFAKLNDFNVLSEDKEIYLKNGVEYPIFNLRYEG
jgi:site-specific DNA-adenine methylase